MVLMKNLDLLTLTASDLQALLTKGDVTSKDLVKCMLHQITRYNHKLNAVISTPPKDIIFGQAEALDKERKNGSVRGPLHGIPILVKDNFNTDLCLGVDTTAGSYAFVGTQPTSNSRIVQKLVDAGALVLGKANLSELAYFKGVGIPWGWSALGGQTQSAYVSGGVRPDDGPGGHWNPAGSSSGSAVGVSAGFAPVSIGTDTAGSLINPAIRAALYAMRLTVGLAPMEGVLPVCPLYDTGGPMAKSVKDMADMVDIIVDRSSPHVSADGYAQFLCGDWSDLSVGTLDPAIWYFEKDIQMPYPEATEQISRETRAAYERIRGMAKKIAYNVPLVNGPPLAKCDSDGNILMANDFNHALKTYNKTLGSPLIHTVEELVKFNEEHAGKELPTGFDNQDILKDCVKTHLDPETYEALRHSTSRAVREDGVDKILREYNLDVIIGPADSDMETVYGISGYPVVTLPLGYLDLNGRPFGLAAITSAYGEATLLRVASAWEKTFSKRRPPKLE
ncbi:MAG: hypothetical protein M1840_000227 [Geoglossum simile]|nr:MAG: hypothetical protein M1840_000227 [Geoglossum simile]